MERPSLNSVKVLKHKVGMTPKANYVPENLNQELFFYADAMTCF